MNENVIQISGQFSPMEGLLLATLLLLPVSWVLLRLIRMNVKTNWAGYAACICALLYAIPHFWFGLGVSFMFPGDFETSTQGMSLNLFANYFMGTVAVGASVFGLSFVRPWGDKLPRWFKVLFAWFGSILLSFWGSLFFVMQFSAAIGVTVSAPAFAEAHAHPMAVWGYYWYAVFLPWGISLGVAAFTEYNKIDRVRRGEPSYR